MRGVFDFRNLKLLAPMAVRAAQAALMAIDPYLKGQRELNTRYKKDESPVTDADRAAQEAIEKFLAPVRPHMHIVSEERRRQPRKDGKPYILVDPIDGTKRFIQYVRGETDKPKPFYVNIAAMQDGEPVAAAITNVLTRELLITHRGIPALAFPCIDDALNGRGELNFYRAKILGARSNLANLSISFAAAATDEIFHELGSFLQGAFNIPSQYVRQDAVEAVIGVYKGEADAAVRINAKGQGAPAHDDAAHILLAKQAGAQVLFIRKEGNSFVFNEQANFVTTDRLPPFVVVSRAAAAALKTPKILITSP